MMFHGCGTALVTPFLPDLSLDESALRALVRRQIDQGINFLVPCGTTGESPTLSFQEKARVIEITIQESAGRVPVMAGAGGYDTAHVIRAANHWLALGASAILSVAPYYNKPSQEGIYRHYAAIADAVNAPIYVYNVPGRTGINVEPATLLRLAQIPNIAGVKEASGNIPQIASILARVPQDFVVLSGDDALTIPVIALGGHGLISVVANQIPSDMTLLTQAARATDLPTARDLQRKYQRLMELNFVESNPIPVKASLALMGLCGLHYRLPLCPPSDSLLENLRQELLSLGLLETA
jgi:4-hydroxy-tetrahydrodipicolinate synthase